MTSQPIPEQEVPKWYVLAEPGEPVPDDYTSLAATWAAAVGGRPNPVPHVTLAYFEGDADGQDLAGCFRGLKGPELRIRAHDMMSFRGVLHPIFGYSLSMQVEKDQAMAAWYRAIVAAFAPMPLRPIRSWEESRPHLQVLRGMTVDPSEAMRRLGARDWTLSFPVRE